MIVYDRKVKRYRRNGRFIALRTIRAEIEKAVEMERREMKKAGRRLAKKQISQTAWRDEMEDRVKTLLILTTAVGAGGLLAMTAAKWDKITASVEKQFKFLDRFEKRMKDLSESQIENRSGLYAMAGRTAYFESEKEAQIEAGKLLCRRIINSKEGCSECADWANAGWVPIDEQPDIGDLLCQSFCACDLEYE